MWCCFISNVICTTLSLTSAPTYCVWSTPRPGRFTVGKEMGYPLYTRRGGPQCRSGRVCKYSPLQGFERRTVQAVASRYTDWGMPAYKCTYMTFVKSVKVFCDRFWVQEFISKKHNACCFKDGRMRTQKFMVLNVRFLATKSTKGECRCIWIKWGNLANPIQKFS